MQSRSSFQNLQFSLLGYVFAVYNIMFQMELPYKSLKLTAGRRQSTRSGAQVQVLDLSTSCSSQVRLVSLDCSKLVVLLNLQVPHALEPLFSPA